MIEHFEVGEVAIVHRPGTKYHGAEVTIMGPLIRATAMDSVDGSSFTGLMYPISAPLGDLARFPGGWLCPPERLRKKRPPGEQTGTWDHCVWKPAREAVL